MKIKLVRFLAFDGSAIMPRQLPGIGRVNSLAVGDTVRDVVDNEAIVSSLDYEPRSGAIVIRKAKHPDNPVDASRSWNRSPREGNNNVSAAEPKGDWCAISIAGAQIVGDDAVAVEAPKKQEKPAALPQCSKCGKDSQGEPVCVECSLKATNEAIATKAQAAQTDPPPAQPIQKQQGQNRR